MKYLSEYRDAEQGILMTVKQLESRIHKLENQYSRIVRPEGNPQARAIIESVFEISDRERRGIGNIPGSGYELKPAYQSYDANLKFDIDIVHVPENEECIAGKILKGIKKPYECLQFGKNV
jgi:hydrogenase expression/formation protein HypD